MANEDLLLRQMPHSLEGEQAVLGSMLIDEGCVKDVMDKLVPSDFYLRQNREIFETIYSMFTYAKPIDGITVCEEMQKAGTYDENTTRSYLAQLMEITPTSANVMEYVAIVRDKALLRGVAQAAGEITVLVQEGIGEAAAILEAAEQKIYAVRRGQSAQDMVPLRMVLPDVLDRLNEMSESESRLPGLSTGLSAVDRKISGLNKSDLILLAARPGMGKTSFALNVALNVAKAVHKTVAVFSLEMSREQLATRLLASEALVENNRLKTGALRETWEELGIPESAVTVIGEMDFIHIRAGSLLRPVLGEVDPAALAAMRPAPEEVAGTFLLPLRELKAHPPEVYLYRQPVEAPDFPYADAGVPADYPWRPWRLEVPVYHGLPYHLWGITARITMDVVDKL